jgi:hypothetical protein
MAKLTVAKINEMARGVAMEEIAKNGLANFLQVEGTKFAKDFEFETEEGTMVKTVRIDVVVPKLDKEENAETLAQDYQFRMAEKEENAKAKAEAKAKKIARDKKLREEKKSEKGQ